MRSAALRVLGLGALLALTLAPLAPARADPAVVRIDRVRLAPAREALPPPADSAAWRWIDLPRDWRPIGDGVPIWCLAEFTLAELPNHPLQLLVPQAGYGAEIFLNGRSIGAQGLPPDAVWGRREPVSLVLPDWPLHTGRNEIALRIQVRPDFAGFLTPLWIGEPEAVQLRLAVLLTLLSLPDFLALFSLALAVASWVVYRSERRQEWFWLALACLIFSVTGMRWRAIDFWLWPLGIAGAACCFACALHRVAGLERRRVESGLFAALAVLTALTVAFPVWHPQAAGADALFGAGVTVYALSLYRGRAIAAWLIRPAVSSTLLISANDWPLYWDRGPWLGIPLLPIAHVFVLLASAFQLVLFLSTRLAQVRSANRELEESRDRVVALEREQATRSERVRLQRELHDGLGAQLVGALAIAERQPQGGSALPDALRGALGELRVAVDSLDAEERELVEVLGSLRARLEPLVQGSGIAFSWQVADVASARGVPPEHAVHLLRLLQEAIANVVKHARARRIEVRSGDALRNGAPIPFVEVQDDGRGFGDPAAGRGLENMRRRAELIGGRLEIASDSGGTRVRLWLPPAAA